MQRPSRGTLDVSKGKRQKGPGTHFPACNVSIADFGFNAAILSRGPAGPVSFVRFEVT